MRGAQAKKSYTFWWVFQRFSGVVLFVTLIGHMMMVHFNLGDFKAVALKPEDLAQRFNDPVMQLFYAVFLLMAIPHGINGALNAIDDYIRHDVWRLVLTWLAWGVGLVILIWGLLTLV